MAPLTRVHRVFISACFPYHGPKESQKASAGGVALSWIRCKTEASGQRCCIQKTEIRQSFSTHWRNLCSGCPLPVRDFCETEQRNATHPLPTPGTLQDPQPGCTTDPPLSRLPNRRVPPHPSHAISQQPMRLCPTSCHPRS